MLREAAAAHPDIQWVGVSHAPTRATAKWCDTIGGLDGVRVLIDEGRVHYATWGLGRSRLGHFLGRRSLEEVAHFPLRVESIWGDFDERRFSDDSKRLIIVAKR